MRQSHERSERGDRSPGRPGRRHRARRGAVAAAVLELLDERPMHGYELIGEMESRSGGRWRPSAGAMYPALDRLEERAMIDATELDGKRRFALTEKGRNRLAELREAGEEAPWKRRDVSGDGGADRRAVAELIGQTKQIARFGTPAQNEAARAVLEEATRALYRITATPDEGDAVAENT